MRISAVNKLQNLKFLMYNSIWIKELKYRRVFHNIMENLDDNIAEDEMSIDDALEILSLITKTLQSVKANPQKDES